MIECLQIRDARLTDSLLRGAVVSAVQLTLEKAPQEVLVGPTSIACLSSQRGGPELGDILTRLYWSGDRDATLASILGLELIEAQWMLEPFRAELEGQPYPSPFQNEYGNEEPDNEY